MKYFLIETDEKNKIPYNINKNRILDIRLLTRENIDSMAVWNVAEMDFPQEGFFPDMLCHPCIMLSKMCIETSMMYQEDIPYKGIKLWDRRNGANATYFLPVLDELDCMSDKTIFNAVGNRILSLILDKRKIDSKAVFRIKNSDKRGMVGREDFVESILRRDARGICLTEIDII